jgi:hypothetical protein
MSSVLIEVEIVVQAFYYVFAFYLVYTSSSRMILIEESYRVPL